MAHGQQTRVVDTRADQPAAPTSTPHTRTRFRMRVAAINVLSMYKSIQKTARPGTTPGKRERCTDILAFPLCHSFTPPYMLQPAFMRVSTWGSLRTPITIKGLHILYNVASPAHAWTVCARFRAPYHSIRLAPLHSNIWPLSCSLYHRALCTLPCRAASPCALL